MFNLNYEYLFEIDVTPLAETPTWAVLSNGVSDITPSMNEDLDQTKYLSGDGYGDTDVVGAQETWELVGHRDYEDEAQNFVFGKQRSLGAGRKTNFRVTDPSGARATGPCTMANIVAPNGSAGAKGAISLSVHFNGKPTSELPSVAPALTTSFAGGSVAGSTAMTATAGAENTLGYKIYGASEPTASNLYARPTDLDSYDYTSGDDIPSTGAVISADTYIIAYELDANQRVVKADVHKILVGEITA